MNKTELIILIVCLVVFMFGMSLVLIQNAKGKIKKLKSKSDAKSDPNKEERKTKTKHLRPVVLTPKPAPEKEPEQQTKIDISSKARNAENTEDISFEADFSDNDIINIDELKTFVDERPKSQPRRTISTPSISEPMQVYDGLPEDFKDDVLPGDDIFGKPVEINPRRPQTSSTPSEFMSNRGDDKKLYEELKSMSPEMKKIIIADILKRRDNQ